MYRFKMLKRFCHRPHPKIQQNSQHEMREKHNSRCLFLQKASVHLFIIDLMILIGFNILQHQANGINIQMFSSLL